MGTNEQTPQGEQPDGQEPTGQSQFRDQAGKARELGERWMGQLQEMIDQAGRQAGPVLRDVAAKAAELAAVAAENAGPVAHKAASVTESVGDKLAVRSKDLASDLRRAAEAARAAQAAEKSAEETPAGEEPKSDGGAKA